VESITDLLSEYDDLFATTFIEMKGIAGELGEMKIPLRPKERSIRQRPYRLNPIYKQKVKAEIDRILKADIIETVEESEWISPMVQQDKKQGGIRICVDLRNLNDACLHDPFPTLFTNEVLETIGGHKAYSFTDGFLGYHRIKITQEDRYKTMFVTKWGSYQYTVMPFGLKNAPTIFSRVVIATFKEFIHPFLEVYLDDWTVYSLLKEHIEVLCLMLERCRKCQMSLNINKCIFRTPFGILLGHIVCKQGLLVDPTKIAIIVNLPPPKTISQLRATLGHTRYYMKFIKGYAQITAPMEKILRKDTKFQWNDECQHSLDTLKENMVIAPILVFPDWEKTFHVHVDASTISLGAILVQLGEGDLDHPIAFARRKLSDSDQNCKTTEREDLAMVYALQKFIHYLLGKHFKMFTDHSALKYLVNNPVLGERICRWLLLF
jgi:hypothetical protein